MKKSIWEEYKHIKCGDFIKWWDKLNSKQKKDWQIEKEKIDLKIEEELWDREKRRIIRY